MRLLILLIFIANIAFANDFVQITEQEHTFGSLGTNYTVRLGHEIGDTEQYFDLCNLLKNATANDKIEFILVGNGGDSQSMFMLVHALQHTAADVTMHVVGDVYSAHATLSLMGNHHVFERNVKFLFHLAHSDRPYDQLDPNVKQILDAVNEEFIQEFGTQLKEIVTPEQYDRILNHLDVIVGGDQVLQGVTQ